MIQSIKQSIVINDDNSSYLLLDCVSVLGPIIIMNSSIDSSSSLPPLSTVNLPGFGVFLLLLLRTNEIIYILYISYKVEMFCLGSIWKWRFPFIGRIQEEKPPRGDRIETFSQGKNDTFIISRTDIELQWEYNNRHQRRHRLQTEQIYSRNTFQIGYT